MAEYEIGKDMARLALEDQLSDLRAENERLQKAADDLAGAEDDAQSATRRANELEARLNEVVSEATGLLDKLAELGQEAERWTNANRHVR